MNAVHRRQLSKGEWQRLYREFRTLRKRFGSGQAWEILSFREELAEPPETERTPLSPKEVQYWFGKEYGRLIHEAWEREQARTTSRDHLEQMAYEQLRDEVHRAYETGEIIRTRSGRVRFRSRKTPNWRDHSRIAELVEIKRKMQGLSLSAAIAAVADEQHREESGVAKYHREHRDTAWPGALFSVAFSVESALLGGMSLDDACTAVAREFKLPVQRVRSIYEIHRKGGVFC